MSWLKVGAVVIGGIVVFFILNSLVHVLLGLLGALLFVAVIAGGGYVAYKLVGGRAGARSAAAATDVSWGRPAVPPMSGAGGPDRENRDRISPPALAKAAADSAASMAVDAKSAVGRYRRQAVSFATASSGPSSVTCAALARPMDHMVSSAGEPVTVTDGAAVFATIRSSLPLALPGEHDPGRRRAQEHPGALQPLPQRLRQAGVERPLRPAHRPRAARPRDGRSTPRYWPPRPRRGSRTATAPAART